MMTNQEVIELIKKFNAGHCTEEEQARLDQWYYNYNEEPIDLNQDQLEEIKKQVRLNLLKPEYKSPITLWTKIIGIASAVTIITLGVLFYHKTSSIKDKPDQIAEIQPGGNRAKIILANGKTVVLNAQNNSVIANGTGLSYEDGTHLAGAGDQAGLNTISTPKGGEYQIILEDGTKVWLNAATVLKYPTSFLSQKIRTVELISGEAFFQVTKDQQRPFVVTSKSQKITVLGTSFNVNASSEQTAVKTTLLEGSVKVAIIASGSEGTSTTIKPGEQTIVQDENITVQSVDTSLETAWKNGMIQFENADLRTVMSMLSNWYQIEVDYQYYPSAARFTGSVARTKPIADIVKLIESTGDAHLKIEGRRITVKK